MTVQSVTAPQAVHQQTAVACKTSAWDCQSHSFLGSPETVATNLASLPDELVRRRVYMLMIQGEGRAEARIFERFDIEDTDGTVAHWEEDDIGGLVTQITDVLVANKGVHCPGEQVKMTLEGDREFMVDGPAPAPKTAAEAFASALTAYQDHKFVQATVMALC
jgi:hypothetical protein